MSNKAVYDASLDAEMEGRNKVNFIRGNNQDILLPNGEKVGRIEKYSFEILIRDKEALSGEFSREEMDLVYKLYSSEGSNLTQRSVSRYFPNYTFQDFKRILRAFNVTKASSPFAPHVIEEKNTDELIQLTLQSKENDYLRKLEQDRNKLTEVKLKEMTKNYFDLRQQISNFSEFQQELVNSVKNTELFVLPKFKNNGKAGVFYLSDMHIGADVSSYSIYNNTFNMEEATKRMNTIFEEIIKTQNLFKFTEIHIINVGDSLDGYNGETTRGGHSLPQNMNNKDQYKNYLTLMVNLFTSLAKSGLFSNINYTSCESGNHDGDFGWMANKSLEAMLSIMCPDIKVKIFDKFIDYVNVLDHTYIISHGKDARDMFKNMPLTINDKTENFINEYLDNCGLNGKNIHFIKGDLHQSATTYAKRFRYKSVASFFGSSQWIHVNFGNTKAAIDFEVIVDDNIYESRITLN